MNRTTYRRPVPAKSFANTLDNFFNSSISDLIEGDFSGTKPSVNIIEDKDNYQIELAAPGLKKEDFHIMIDKDQLIVESKIEKSEETTDQDRKYTRREFQYGSFKRSFHLSDKINSEKIDASYTDGILILTIEKREEAKEKAPRNIEIS